MFLAYFIVCPWEAVAVGKLMAFLSPAGRVGAVPHCGPACVFTALVAGSGIDAVFGVAQLPRNSGQCHVSELDDHGGARSVPFSVAVSGHMGTVANFRPYFSHTPLLSILLTLQIVPYFITGFESVPKVAEESHPGFPPGDFFRAIAMALLVGAGFYVLAVGAVAYIAPWQGLVGQSFATAIAFGKGTGSSWIVRLILGITLVGLLQVFNGNFVAATRLLFAFGRRRIIPPVFAKIDALRLTPSVAITGVTVATLVGLLVGDALLVPVTEVGSMASAFGWLAACVSLYMVDRRVRLRLVASAWNYRVFADGVDEMGAGRPGAFHRVRMDRTGSMAGARDGVSLGGGRGIEKQPRVYF